MINAKYNRLITRHYIFNWLAIGYLIGQMALILTILILTLVSSATDVILEITEANGDIKTLVKVLEIFFAIGVGFIEGKLFIRGVHKYLDKEWPLPQESKKEEKNDEQ